MRSIVTGGGPPESAAGADGVDGVLAAGGVVPAAGEVDVPGSVALVPAGTVLAGSVLTTGCAVGPWPPAWATPAMARIVSAVVPWTARSLCEVAFKVP
jgi:hypothetical protein